MIVSLQVSYNILYKKMLQKNLLKNDILMNVFLRQKENLGTGKIFYFLYKKNSISKLNKLCGQNWNQLWITFSLLTLRETKVFCKQL